MFAGSFGRGRHPQQLPLGQRCVGEYLHGGDPGGALGQGPGLVEGHSVGETELFHHDSGLHEHPVAPGVGDRRDLGLKIKVRGRGV